VELVLIRGVKVLPEGAIPLHQLHEEDLSKWPCLSDAHRRGCGELGDRGQHKSSAGTSPSRSVGYQAEYLLRVRKSDLC
jgi:hypothetical protein